MATLYCRVNASTVTWNTLSRWFQDAAFTIPATALPLSTDDVVITFTNTSSTFSLLSNGTRTVNSMIINGPTGSGSTFGNVEGTFIVNGNVTANNYTRIVYCTMTATGTITLNNNSRITFSSINITANGGIVCNDYSAINPNFGGYTFNTPSVVCNDYSVKVATITATCTFNDYAVNSYTVNGNATFNDNSGQVGGGSGRGIINGNATITSSILYYRNESNPGSYFGSYAFPVYYTASSPQSVTGTVTFSSVTPVSIIVGNSTEDAIGWNMNSSSWIFSGGTPSWTFNAGAYMDSGTLSGNAIFTGNSYFSSGTITGNVTFEDTSYNNGTLTLASGKNATFTENSFNIKTISGTVIYNGLTGENIYGYFVKGEKYTFIKIPVIVSNNTIFNNKSACGLVLDAGALSLLQGSGYTNITYVAIPTITGNVSFKNSAINLGLVTGNATFINRAENKSGISGTTTTTPDRGVNGSSILGVI